MSGDSSAVGLGPRSLSCSALLRSLPPPPLVEYIYCIVLLYLHFLLASVIIYYQEASTDARLARDADTWDCKQLKRQKKETKQLISDFVSDSSEDDLFKKAGSLGSDADQPSMLSEPSLSFELENKDDNLAANEANDQVSSKLETEDVAASDLGML
ncbi:unnamed protein product [Ranitomeya imitator]|uniref:Uncharacterized protein n=1 Tax=Ranitomeya imitator TaxID=111125 RepID=A0ABN9MNW0_9NEOB|nr:unnamed protein product [Ranitomeya imitator]